MSKFTKIPASAASFNTNPPTIQVPALGSKGISNGKEGLSQFRNSDYDSSAYSRSIISNLQLCRSKTDRDLPQKEDIFKGVRTLF